LYEIHRHHLYYPLILLFLIQPFLQKKYAFEYKFRLKRLNYEKKSLKTKLIFLKN
jgi:hypothetical protein